MQRELKALGPNKIRNIIKEVLKYYHKITRAKGEKVFWKMRYKSNVLIFPFLYINTWYHPLSYIVYAKSIKIFHAVLKVGDRIELGDLPS